MKTVQVKPAEVKRSWHVIDAKGKVLGQVCTQVAKLLIGKHKVTFTPHVDGGDYVIVLNAKDVVVTGGKAGGKMYYSHSGIPGGFKAISFEKQMEKDPRKVIVHGVYGMLPKNKMRNPRIARLKVYVNDEHPHKGQLQTKKSE